MTNPNQNGQLFFEFADQTGRKQPLFFENPIEIIKIMKLEEVKTAFEKIQAAIEEGYFAAGYLSYEAAPAFDQAFSVQSNHKLPLLWFGIFKNPVKKNPEFQTFKVGEWEPDTSKEEYHTSIKNIKEAIKNGNTYQVNYTIRLRSFFEGDEFAFYHQLSKAQSSNYSAYINTGQFKILSASPELFFHWKDGEITTRPMKGTCKRGLTFKEDEKNARWLHLSEKNRAENVMIVDLLRNDLGKIAIPGSVKVPKLFEIEKYPTVLQMTSTITAKTKSEIKLFDIFSALFPCGSITGAPKISTMKMISSLERSPREVYCGTIGYITPMKEAIFNVPIRTVVIDSDNKKMEYGVGGGITWDSEIEDEYQEALTKAALLKEAMPKFDLLESLLLENGCYVLFERHMKRLKQSASYFGFTLLEQEIREKLLTYAGGCLNSKEKVRLMVEKSGEFFISGEKLTPLNGDLLVQLAQTPISKTNRFLYHKTTFREVYESKRPMDSKPFDILLWNEEGELTEFTIGNLVVELGGNLYTPPVHCGLLGGTLREKLIENGEIIERVLVVEDLARASKIWLINSVRGWITVQLI